MVFRFAHPQGKPWTQVRPQGVGNSTSNKISFSIASVTTGAAHLADLPKEGRALSKIESEHWDYVVLQDNSTWVFGEENVNESYEAAGKFITAIVKSGGKPYLYLTWARQPGSSWYSKAESEFLQNPEYMQSQLDFYTYNLAKQTNSTAVPVGDL